MGTAVDDDEFRATIADRLANLFAGQRLQFFRLSADQNDCLRKANVAMSRQRAAEILKERSQTESVRDGVVFSLDNFGREFAQSSRAIRWSDADCR